MWQETPNLNFFHIFLKLEELPTFELHFSMIKMELKNANWLYMSTKIIFY